ncbi:MAG: hypothetical protein EXR50_00845 [Dehalococcoidia bacterium]|nr:hypothetical protein [Dehalococcoidia bacterium]
MQQPLDDLLQQGIDSVANGGAIEDFLALHQEHAAELRELLQIAVRVSATLVEAPANTRAKTATLNLVLERSRKRPARANIMPFAPMFHLRQMAAVLIAVAVLILAPASALIASANTLPGDALYSVKEVWEGVQLALAFDDDAKTDTYTRLALRRTEEIAELNRVGRPVPPEAINTLSQYTAAVISGLEDKTLSTTVQQRFEELTQRQQDVLKAVAAGAPATAQQALQHALDVSRRGHETALAKQESNPQSGDSSGAGPKNNDEAANNAKDNQGRPIENSQPQGPYQQRSSGRESANQQQDSRSSNSNDAAKKEQDSNSKADDSNKRAADAAGGDGNNSAGGPQASPTPGPAASDNQDNKGNKDNKDDAQENQDRGGDDNKGGNAAGPQPSPTPGPANSDNQDNIGNKANNEDAQDKGRDDNKGNNPAGPPPSPTRGPAASDNQDNKGGNAAGPPPSPTPGPQSTPTPGPANSDNKDNKDSGRSKD